MKDATVKDLQIFHLREFFNVHLNDKSDQTILKHFRIQPMERVQASKKVSFCRCVHVFITQCMSAEKGRPVPTHLYYSYRFLQMEK